MEKIPVHKSIRFKLIGAFTVVVLAASVAGAMISIRIAEREFREIIYKHFHTTTLITENFIDFLGQTALMRAKALAADEVLARHLAGGSEEEAIKYISEQMRAASADMLILIDREGHVVARGHEPESRGDSIIGVDMVRKTLGEGEPTTSIVRDRNNFIVFASALIPGEITGEAEGAVLVGYSINDTFVENIKKNMDMDIAIIRDRAVMAATIRDEAGTRISNLPVPYLEYQMLLEGQIEVLETTIFGKRYFVNGMNLTGMAGNLSGSLLMLHPTGELDSTKSDLVRDHATLFAIIFLAVIFIEFTLSRRMLAPIGGLLSATDRIAAGDLNARAEVTTTDEFGRLSSHFNEMASSLGEKEAELKRYSEGLEEMVAARTRDLDESNRLKELFMDIVCHDMSGPVNVILNSSEHLRDMENEKEKMEIIDIVNESSMELRNLISDASAYSKLESMTQISRSWLDLAAIVADAARSVTREASDKGSTVEVVCDGKHAIMAHSMIKDVFTNLISNAIKYGDDNAVVKVEITSEDGAKVVSVTDTGPGIPEADKEKVFQRFERLEKRNIKGKGLGLAIAKRIVMLHSGTIRIEDNPVGGSVFKVSLPIEVGRESSGE